MIIAPRITEEDMLARVLHRDGLVLVINKPAGIPVHAGPGGGPNLEYYFKYLQFGLPNPPALAHRLDRDTSGCLIVGRHRKALRKMSDLFQNGGVKKTYWAVCVGAPPADEGVCSMALRKQSNQTQKWWMEVCAADAEGAVTAETAYKVLAKNETFSLVEFSPRTGRTHQIRVHAAALGCPLLGEQAYGDLSALYKSVPIHLHARSVEFTLQASKGPIYVEAPLTDFFAETLAGEGLMQGVSSP